MERRARQHQRRIEDEAALTLAASVGVDDTLPDDLVAAIATLSTLDDALQRVSRSQPTVEDGVLLDALANKQRRRALTPADERMLTVLIDRHDRVMVLRAEAVALLKERGVDVQGRVAGA